MSMPNEGTVGWRFSPKDEELINYFLRRKINGKDEEVKIIREIDVCKSEPWDLPGQSVLKSDDNEWFFFCPRDQKFASSSRLNRATGKGFWKATGKDRKIKSKNKKSEIGMKKTLVFHTGRAPEGKRTYWVMHEYRATLKELDGTHPGQKPYVLCRLFKKDDDSILDATENNVEVASLSPIPCELSIIELKAENVSNETRSLSEQECEKALVTSTNFNGENSNATSQEPQQDMNLEYLNWILDPDPNDLSLLESPTVESMGSSLLPNSAADKFCIGQDDFTSDILQSILTDSLDYCGDFDFEIPGLEFMNQFQVPDTEMHLQSGKDAALEPNASNAASSGPIPSTDDTWTEQEYRGDAFLGSSSSDNTPSSNDHCTQTGIQIRQRQLQTTQNNTNFNNHGTAQRRIRLQTNLISTESEATKQTFIKKFITTVSSFTISHKFIIGLASITLTMFVAYAGKEYIS